ncbi:MAG: hypothetical protein HY369_03760 [Candidatus Aenigmarchaeota archaeon]|nr:hypothetical protein [Candidatus Aenigmarchaeota archaeon]
MISLTEEQIRAIVVHNISRKREQYINVHFAVKSLPPHLRNEALRIVKAMVKDGLLFAKKGDCVGIRRERIDEIHRLLEVYYSLKGGKV